MLQDLDATLAALLKDKLGIDRLAISFATPDDQSLHADVTPPAINLFLYDVLENHGLRSNQWEETRDAAGMTTRKRAPVRVDCSYLITAWPGDVPNPAAEEHLLLGAVLKVLLRYRTIPPAYLAGELQGQEPPVRAKIIVENQLRSLGEFWQAMGGKPKATLHYTVTIGIDVGEPQPVGPEVKQKVMRLGQGAGGEQSGVEEWVRPRPHSDP